jgi:Family of unknown function (DUF5681)
MSDQRSTREYEVGFGKPPKAYQFKRGQSGNSKGRPKKSGQTDVAGILGEPLTVTTAGMTREMSAFEIGARQLVKRALNKHDLKALLAFVELCENYGVMPPVPPAEAGGGVLVVPWDWDEWRPMFEKLDPQR